MATVFIYWKSGSHTGVSTIQVSNKASDKHVSRRLAAWKLAKKHRKKTIMRREVKLGAS